MMDLGMEASKKFSTVKFASVLLFALIIASLGRALLPNTAGSDIYSAIIASLLAGLALTTAVCTVQRFLGKQHKNSQGPRTLAFSKSAIWSIDPRKTIMRRLVSKGFRLEHRDDGSSVGIKYNWAWLASLGFHLGLVVFLIGLGVNNLYELRGVAVLAEGSSIVIPNSLSLNRQGYLAKPQDEFQLSLEQLQPVYVNESLEQFESLVRISGGGATGVQKIYVNKPGRFGRWSILARNWGYAPFVTIFRGDQQIFNNWLNLHTDFGHEQVKFSDKFLNISGGLTLEIEVFPDYTENNGLAGTNSYLPNNPYLHIVLKDEQQGQELINELLPKGQSATVNNWRVEFGNLRHYESFDIVKDPGEYIIAFGAWLCGICGLLRAVYYRRRVWFKIEPCDAGYQVSWGAWSEYFRLAQLDKMTAYFKEERV